MYDRALRTVGIRSFILNVGSELAYGVRFFRNPSLANCGASYGPSMTTSNWPPPAATSRVVTCRRVVSSSTV